MKDHASTGNSILDLIHKEHPNYHPLVSLAEIALEQTEEGGPLHEVKVRVDCHKTIARYVSPELKSVEMKADIDADFGALTVRIINETGTDLGEAALASEMEGNG